MVVSAMNNEPAAGTIPSEFAGVFSVACAPTTIASRCGAIRGTGEWGAAGIDVEVAWTAAEPWSRQATRSQRRGRGHLAASSVPTRDHRLAGQDRLATLAANPLDNDGETSS